MQNFRKNEKPRSKVFLTKLEDIPGGVTVAVKDLNASRICAGTPIGPDKNGLYHVTKTAVIAVQSTDENVKVAKGHNFKKGDILATGNKGYAINSIDQSPTDHDVLVVATSLGTLNKGTVLYEGDKSAASGVTFKVKPTALVGSDIDVTPTDNHTVDAIVRGTVIEANIENAPISPEVKAALTHIIFK